MIRNNPDTSRAAYHNLNKDAVEALKKKILEALKVMKRGSSEQIADYLKMKNYDSVWKRCSDLKNEGKIFASDFKVKTKRQSMARQWMIYDPANPNAGSIPEKIITESQTKLF